MNQSYTYPDAYAGEHFGLYSNLAEHSEENICPAVQVTDMQQLLKIEIFIPGFRREDFFVSCNPTLLHVYAMWGINDGSVSFPGTFEKWINLPAEVDVEFISAEYVNGILRFHLPKAGGVKNLKQENHEVVIY